MNKVSMIAALLGSTATIGVLSVASPASAITWKLDGIPISGAFSSTVVDYSSLPVTVTPTTGPIGAGSNVKGSFDFDSTGLSNVNISSLILGVTGFPSFTTNYDIYTPVFNGTSLASINFSSSSLPAGVQTNGLTLDFSPVPGISPTAMIGDKITVTGGTVTYSASSTPGVTSITSINGNIAPGTTTSVPWETDSLPLIGSTILFGAAISVKRKLAGNKK